MLNKRFLFILLFVIVCVNTMQANNTYYAKLTATSGDTGKGLVYATNSNTTHAASSARNTITTETQSGESSSFTVYASAFPIRGFKFSKWSCSNGVSASSNTGTSDAITVSASSTSSDSPTTGTISATFEEDALTNFTIRRAGSGSISLTQTFYAYSNATAADADKRITSNSTTTKVCVNNDEEILSVYSADVIKVIATPQDGYEFLAWYSVDAQGTETLLTYAETYTTKASATPRLKAKFVSNGESSFLVNNKLYDSLDAAISAAGTSGNIILIANATIPAGNYTIPSGVSLVIPYNGNHNFTSGTQPKTTTTYVTPSLYKTLTLANGANINVDGKIYVEAEQLSAGTSETYQCGDVSGPYGRIHMQQGSNITIKNGGILYARGYITGDGVATGNKNASGNIVAESGAKIYENFIIADWKGGTNTSNMKGNSNKYFPFNQYYIQNIQVPTTIKYGADEIIYTSIYASSTVISAPLTLISKGTSLFKLNSSDASLCKWYDGSTDRMIFDSNGNTSLSSATLDVSYSLFSISITTSDYVLPLNNNMTLDIQSGNMSIDYDAALLPDAKVIVEKDATLNVNASAYIYDIDEWDTYAYSNNYVCPLPYVPNRNASLLTTTRAKKNKSNLSDASIVVNGTLNVGSNGKLYTTESGANITSNNTGTLTINGSIPSNGNTYQWITSSSTSDGYRAIAVTPAQLHNTDGSFVASKSNTTFYYYKGAWNTTPCTFTPGDIKEDGDINKEDVKALMNIMLGNDVDETQYNHEAADVNGDGKYGTISDITTLIDILSKQGK